MRPCSTCSVEKTLTPLHHPPIQGSVTNTYRTRTRFGAAASTLVQLTWTRTRTGPSLALSINGVPIPAASSKGTVSCPLPKSATSVAGISWDFSSAKFRLGGGPEPASGFYVVVVVDGEVAVAVGDRSQKFAEGLGCGEGQFRMVRRAVEVVGRAVYSTRARFCEGGKEHEVGVRLQEGEVGSMGVYVDERRVVEVRRLRWNFRGKETVFVDGLAVDVMWDLMRWLFPAGGGGGAVLLFRTREGEKSRWWEEGEEEEGRGFSLLVQICM